MEIPLRTDVMRTAPPSNPDFLIFPVPASDALQVHLNGSDLIESLILYDLTGKVVYQSEALSVKHLNIDTHSLPGGSYIASARTSGGTVQRKFQIAH
jgi:hypothetical protein